MLPYALPFALTISILLVILYILLKRCFQSNAPKKYTESMRFSYPSRIRQRDYQPLTSNPRIIYVQRKTTYRNYFSDSDFQDDDVDFARRSPSPPIFTSNIENQKGGFDYTVINEESAKREQSPVLPRI
ncbi:hypothetical protein M9Y10_041121 [Tritrichomonas musculus]|uniref:Uncharacterized protein n=1 Tax=Tritrichomonas musculus TaxID=1915356 RepID=A0ABR2K3P5_9EUKA